MSVRRWMPAVGVTLIAAVFTWLNRGERVIVDVGLFRFYRAPLTMVAFVAFLAGMLSMLALSLRHDRRVREELRARGLLEPAPPRPSAPAASAWGVAREPAPRGEDRTVAYARVDEDRPEHDEERTVGYPRLEDGDEDRTAAYPRLEEDGDDDGRTAAYPRRDEDPAA